MIAGFGPQLLRAALARERGDAVEHFVNRALARR